MQEHIFRGGDTGVPQNFGTLYPFLFSCNIPLWTFHVAYEVVCHTQVTE